MSSWKEVLRRPKADQLSAAPRCEAFKAVVHIVYVQVAWIYSSLETESLLRNRSRKPFDSP